MGQPVQLDDREEEVQDATCTKDEEEDDEDELEEEY
jgi:hypothetical protein